MRYLKNFLTLEQSSNRVKGLFGLARWKLCVSRKCFAEKSLKIIAIFASFQIIVKRRKIFYSAVRVIVGKRNTTNAKSIAFLFLLLLFFTVFYRGAKKWQSANWLKAKSVRCNQQTIFIVMVFEFFELENWKIWSPEKRVIYKELLEIK